MATIDFKCLHALLDAKPSEKCVLRLANGCEFIVVKSALAARSKYFAGMFRPGSELKEASEAIVEIDLPYNKVFKDMWMYLMTGSRQRLIKPKDFVENAKNADYLGVEPRGLFLDIFRANMNAIVKANVHRLEEMPRECVKRLGIDYLKTRGIKSPSMRLKRTQRRRYSSDEDDSSSSDSDTSSDDDAHTAAGDFLTVCIG